MEVYIVKKDKDKWVKYGTWKDGEISSSQMIQCTPLSEKQSRFRRLSRRKSYWYKIFYINNTILSVHFIL